MIAFLFGFAFEVVYLFWLYCADKGWPLRCAIASMTVGWVSLAGLAEGIKGGHAAGFLVLGYGVGSYVVATVKKHAL
jgi:hypothetical protein